MKPKKHLGQHFLRDQNIAKKICGLLPAKEEDQVIEIGPGEGALTQLLLQKWPNLMVVEFDPDLADGLQIKFGDANRADNGFKIFQGDFLKWDPEVNLNAPAWFIGNLPYNISSQIFFHLIRHRSFVKGGVFMIQKEVADRIASAHGNKTYGILSVLLGYYFEIKPGFKVSEKVFHPQPKVQSAVFSILRRERKELVDWDIFSLIVKKAFNQRRKTLRNALKGLNFTADCETFMGLRAEQLSIDQFEKLALSFIHNHDLQIETDNHLQFPDQ